MPNRQPSRPALAWLAVILAAGVLLPPGATVARHYVFAEATQFAVLAFAVPALLVLGAPWRLLGGGLADHVAIARSHRRAGWPAWASLITFLLVTTAWRLPVAVNALARHPALLAAEAVTLVVAGCALWLELVESPPLLPTIPRPLRAAFAAIPMWATWALAYIMGFSSSVWFSAYARTAGHGLSTVTDQQIAVGLLWAIPALAFAPVVFVTVLGWLRNGADAEPDLADLTGRDAAAEPGLPGAERPPRPPRGWRAPRGWRLPPA